LTERQRHFPITADRNSSIRQESRVENVPLLRQTLRLILKGMLPVVKRLTVTDYHGATVGIVGDRELRNGDG
jgi:hypothetical protein